MEKLDEKGSSSSICVRINNENSVYFKPGKCLRQGDHLSPLMLFTRMLLKATGHNLISGLMPRVVDGGVISLRYADDTLLFLEDNLDKANNLKWLLLCYEKMTGTKINYDKSDLLTIGIDEERVNELAKIFHCKVGNFVIKYLGVPLHFSKLKKKISNQS